MMPSPEQDRDEETAEPTDSSMTDAAEHSPTGFKACFADGVVTFFEGPPRYARRPAETRSAISARRRSAPR